jgi:predicted dehydrogenase
MAPIRVALVGLSSSAKVNWAADAHLPYLLSPNGQKHYKLVALLNSSISAAESAKSTFNLPHDVKAYGDPDSLAADLDIDLVIVNTRVDMHYAVVQPSIRAGKAVFVEWPLTENLASALELMKDLSNPRENIVGLQGRVMPLTLRLKSLLASGLIGKVLSSSIRAFGNLSKRDGHPESLTYFADRKVGGHPINIHYGHMIDYVHVVLGDWEEGGLDVKMQIQRLDLKVFGGKEGGNGRVKSDVPDLLSAHGTLKTTDEGVVVPGATLTASFRLGQPFKGEPGLTWMIAGETGEVRVTAPGPYLMSGDSYNGPVTIEHQDHATDEVKVLEWDWAEYQKELPLRARSTAEVYERYAQWVEAGKVDVLKGRGWPTLEDGLGLMREFDRMYHQFDPLW